MSGGGRIEMWPTLLDIVSDLEVAKKVRILLS